MTRKKFARIGLITLAVIVGIVGILWIIGWVNSPGTTPPITGTNGKPVSGSVAAWEKVTLGGVEQWILVRGKSVQNPVLLFLHGGPGSPEMPMLRAYNERLEDHFIVVNWDQRGSGKSYSDTIPDSTFTIAQFVADTHELTALLCQRFKKNKIYLMGHSWGTVLGVLAVQKNPEPFYAYFGVGQVANMMEGEKISYAFVLDTARKSNNEKAIRELTEIGPPPYTTDDKIDRTLTERNWVTHYGGAWYKAESMMVIAKPIFTAPEYTLSDKGNYLNGSLRTLRLMWPELMNVNLMTQAPELNVPVFIFQGTHDYQTPYALAKQYFDRLQAPHKEFFTFEQTAHSPLYEHPAQFHDIVLNRILPKISPTPSAQ